MSTIILPGGGMGMSIMGLVGNLVALYIVVAVIKYFWRKIEFPSKPINVVSELKRYNIDAEGLFGSKKESYDTQIMKPSFPQ